MFGVSIAGLGSTYASESGEIGKRPEDESDFVGPAGVPRYGRLSYYQSKENTCEMRACMRF